VYLFGSYQIQSPPIGNPNHICDIQLSARSIWISTRSGSGRSRCPQSRLERPVGRLAVDAGTYLSIRRGQSQSSWRAFENAIQTTHRSLVGDPLWRKCGCDFHRHLVFQFRTRALYPGSSRLGPLFPSLSTNLLQILQSGAPATTVVFEPEHRQTDWDAFVGAVPECAATLDSEPRQSFPCMQSVDSSILLNAVGIASGQIAEQFPWVPVLDGPGGLLPELPSILLEKGEFSNLPYISGTTLDEGASGQIR
jgi:hypothetical protein